MNYYLFIIIIILLNRKVYQLMSTVKFSLLIINER